MLFAITAYDKPDHVALRLETRATHLEFIDKCGDQVKLAGPFLADDGETPVGSLLIIEAESLNAAKQWAELDPYARAGLFASVDIRPWKWVIGKPEDKT